MLLPCMSFIPSAFICHTLCALNMGSVDTLKVHLMQLFRVYLLLLEQAVCILAVTATIAWLYAALNTNKWLTLSSIKYYMDLTACSLETVFVLCLFVWFCAKNQRKTLKLRIRWLFRFFLLLTLSLWLFCHQMFVQSHKNRRQLILFKYEHIFVNLCVLTAHCNHSKASPSSIHFSSFSSSLRN